MHQRRWEFIAVALALAGLALYGRPAPAQAQGGPPAVPKKLPTFADFGPGVGRFISTVDDFAGIGAVANIQGTGKDNQGNTLTWEVDVRVFQGAYVDLNQNTNRGTFGFAWLDVFTGSGPTLKQIHELHFPFHGPDTGPTAPSGPIYGPLWTNLIPDASLTGNPFAPMMVLDYKDQSMHDAFQFAATPELLTAKATVHAEWTPGTVAGLIPVGDMQRSYVVREPALGFQGLYTLAQAHVDFSFTTQVSATDKTPFTFTTNPDGQRMLFAQVGEELNGIFFR